MEGMFFTFCVSITVTITLWISSELIENCDATDLPGDEWNALNLLCRYYSHENLIGLVKLLIDKGFYIKANFG